MTYSKTLLFVAFSILSLAVHGQDGIAYDLKKPAKFENRTLASEKSNNGKKIKKARLFIQNTVTHYNYWFNSNEKIKMILARAKAQNKDDYTRLLAFYPFTFEATASQKKELDSVVFKCTTGILIHDTRNSWIDNLYMLIGQAYYYRKTFDSAYISFQFVNWAFAPRDKDGDKVPIGSNANADEGGNANIVSTSEKRNIIKKAFSQPPSRNESLVWKVRTYLAMDRYAEASGLIEVLKKDPQFPPRLNADLAEVQSNLYYKQGIYDSAAWYLEKALPVAGGNEEVARWEYLIAQLYEKVGRSYEAKTFYERVIRHTYNPVLEIYARLNAIRQNKNGGEDFIKQNIDALVKMAHKDRYENYRDIIYYTAAQMELERNNRPGAENFLRLCIQSSAGITIGTQRNKAFLQLANMSFEDKKYEAAKNYYDSLNLNDPSSNLGDLSWLPDRKAALANIVNQLHIIQRQDSLLRIAALPPAQRDAYIKKLVRTLRRQEGLKDEDQGDGGSSQSSVINNNAPPPDLFSSSSGTADWYFNNSALKARGYNDFKSKWGNRNNVDFWQIGALAKQQIVTKPGEKTAAQLDASGKTIGATPAISFKSLMDNLPLTPLKLKKLNDSVEHALYELGKGYQEGISDYSSAISTDESMLEKFPETADRAETLLNLYYCYKKIGDEVNAARILSLLQQKYPGSKYAAMATNPDSTVKAGSRQYENATHQYDKIYNSFIEGRFDEALAEKKIADSLYGDKYWTPQLLYIEAVYHIRNREDQQAIVILSKIALKFPRTPMADKAIRLIDVLKRRREIEDYLTKLDVKKASDDDTVVTSKPTQGAVTGPARPRLVRNDSNMLVKEDTSQLARAKLHIAATPGLQGQKPPTILQGMGPLKVDTAGMRKISMDAGQLARLHHQMDSLQAAMQKATRDSAQMARIRQSADSIQTVMKKLQADTAALVARAKALNSVFSFAPDKPHAVVILLTKVDPVYVTETRNAYNRYNTENFYSQGLSIDNTALNDTLKLVVINSFGNADSALDYMRKARAVAAREVIPWLPADKYTFLIISTANLELLLSNKDMPAYRKFLSAVYPDKF